MSAPARRPANPLDLPDGFSFAGALEGEDFEPSRRADGWTPDRQRLFLVTRAEGATVEAAAAKVGLSPQSAYSFRQRAAGAAFALGWHAALLLQRQKLADTLTSRAFDGQTDTLTRADGTSVQRHRHDNRLALALLSRLDRLAAADERADRHGEAEAARLVAGEWQRYLDLVAADATPAQAGLFLAARAQATPAPTPAKPHAGPTAANDHDPVAALAPVMALARADLYCRARVGTAEEVDVADLDPARRADWTAEQWTRAEAAGLVALAPPAPAPESQLPQHSQDVDDYAEEPVWYDEDLGEYRTSFPPPPGCYPEEEGCYEEPGYSRELTDEEAEIMGPLPEWDGPPTPQDRDEPERAAWFAARAAEAGIAPSTASAPAAAIPGDRAIADVAATVAAAVAEGFDVEVVDCRYRPGVSWADDAVSLAAPVAAPS